MVELGGGGNGGSPAPPPIASSAAAVPKPFPLVVTFEYLDDSGDNNFTTNQFEVESADATALYSYLELWHMEMLCCDDDTLAASIQQLIAFENDDLGKTSILAFL